MLVKKDKIEEAISIYSIEQKKRNFQLEKFEIEKESLQYYWEMCLDYFGNIKKRRYH